MFEEDVIVYINDKNYLSIGQILEIDHYTAILHDGNRVHISFILGTLDIKPLVY